MTTNLDRICNMFRGARERVLIISAYIGENTLEALLSAVPSGVHCEVFASWSAKDIASGASDWQAWDVAKNHNVPMYACERLHAKIYVADRSAFIGSANATKSGLHGGGQGNMEFLLWTYVTQTLGDFIDEVRNKKSPAAPFGPDFTDEQAHDSSLLNNRHIPVWIPRSDPETFLSAMQGQRSHNAETEADRASLELMEGHHNRSAIRLAVYNKTVFRLIRHEFDIRTNPTMFADELRSLLAQQVTPGFEQISTENLNLLVQWLGQFGQNTHKIHSPHQAFPSLRKGRMLGSESEFSD